MECLERLSSFPPVLYGVDRLYSDLQLTLTTMCLCPQTVCQHCTHSHKPEIPNPDYRDITTAALSVVCLSACFSSFFRFSMSSFSLALPSKHHSVSNSLKLWRQLACVCVSNFISLFHFHAAFTLWEPWPIFDLSSHACVCALFTQTCTNILSLNVNQQFSILVVNVGEHKWT